ncbi:hypothetical protein ACS0TY_012907 [Phlomoides rotata]
MSAMRREVPEDSDDDVLDLGTVLPPTVPQVVCLVGRVCAEKLPNIFVVTEVMLKTFNPKGKLTAREWGKGMVLFSFERIDNCDWVLRNQPWHFDGHLFAIKTLISSEQPSLIILRTSSFWTRAHDLSLVYRSEAVIRSIVARVGILELFEKPSMRI